MWTTQALSPRSFGSGTFSIDVLAVARQGIAAIAWVSSIAASQNICQQRLRNLVHIAADCFVLGEASQRCEFRHSIGKDEIKDEHIRIGC